MNTMYEKSRNLPIKLGADKTIAIITGRNPLHELCWCKKDNAATICETFLEFMPDFPINRTDLQVCNMVTYLTRELT